MFFWKVRKVSAAAAERPEQVRVFCCGGRHQFALRSDHLGGDQVIDCHAVATGEPPESAAENQTTDPGGGVNAGRHGQAVFLGLVIDVSERGARSGENPLSDWIDGDRSKAREIDHQRVVGDGGAGNVVAGTANTDREIFSVGKGQRCPDVGRAGALHNQGRAAIDHGVPNDAGIVEVLIGW